MQTELGRTFTTLYQLNALVGGLFLLTAFAALVTRQVQSCVNEFVFQSILLAASAFLLGLSPLSLHLIAVGAITMAIKPFLVPWLLRRTVPRELYTRREITQVVNIPSSLLIALGLGIMTYFIAGPFLGLYPRGIDGANIPIGVAVLLLGTYTITARREALPQLIGILTAENGVFFAGISLAPELPLIAELAAAFDVLIIVLIVGILTRAIHEHVGTTAVGSLTALRER